MDLKTALAGILPKVRLKVPHKDKWVIDRPVEFHECDSCGKLVDQRLLDVVCITCTDDYAFMLQKKYNTWCNVHDDDLMNRTCALAKPCKRCYRWTLTHSKGGVCSMCTHNPHTIMFPPMIALRPWFVKAPIIELEAEVDT